MSQTPQKEISWTAIEETFFAQRTVLFVGEVTEELCGETAKRLMGLQSISLAPITLIIDSPGGSMQEALKLCDIMASVIIAPIRGIAIGQCGSAATFIMLYCHERLGTPHSQFLIHSARRVSIAVPVNATASNHLEQLLRETSATERRIEQLYVERLTPRQRKRKPMTASEKLAFVRKLVARGDQAFDRSMSADEAIEAGLITHIFTGKLMLTPNT